MHFYTDLVSRQRRGRTRRDKWLGMIRFQKVCLSVDPTKHIRPPEHPVLESALTGQPWVLIFTFWVREVKFVSTVSTVVRGP